MVLSLAKERRVISGWDDVIPASWCVYGSKIISAWESTAKETDADDVGHFGYDERGTRARPH